MNYLAHAVLSGTDPDWIAGGFLGDHVRGQRWRGYPISMAAGILLHRRLDSWLDQQPAFVAGRARLGPLRRYGGILFDIGLDHILARDWQRRGASPLSLEAYVARCARVLEDRWKWLPESLRRFARFDREHDQLLSYANEEGVDRALRGIHHRLRGRGPLGAGWTVLAPHLPLVEGLFEQLWPAAMNEASALRPAMRAQAASGRPPA